MLHRIKPYTGFIQRMITATSERATMAHPKQHGEQLLQKVCNDPGCLGGPLPSVKRSSIEARSVDDRPEWQKFTETWTGTKAKDYLRGPLPAEMPSSGPLSNLLATTKKTLCTGHRVSQDDVPGAIGTGAVAVLAMLLGWLQQQPCEHHHSKKTDVLTAHQILWVDLVFRLSHLLDDAIGNHQARCSELLAQLQEDTRKQQHRPILIRCLVLHCLHAGYEPFSPY